MGLERSAAVLVGVLQFNVWFGFAVASGSYPQVVFGLPSVPVDGRLRWLCLLLTSCLPWPCQAAVAFFV